MSVEGGHRRRHRRARGHPLHRRAPRAEGDGGAHPRAHPHRGDPARRGGSGAPAGAYTRS